MIFAKGCIQTSITKCWKPSQTSLRKASDMGTEFRDHPRKKTIRVQWDTPLLKILHANWHADFFYCGLPGPQAIDIKLWRDMISRVIAFEVECPNGNRRR